MKKHIQLYSIILIVVAGVLTFAFFIFSFFQTSSFEASNEVFTEAQATYIHIDERVEWVPELPVRLIIPAIAVDAHVQYVGLDPDGTGDMDVPSNFTDVGWYQEGVRPGMAGSAVIAGHFNGKAVPEAVFFDLHTLEVGDEVVIMSAERIEDIFVVVKIKTYDYDEPTGEVFVSTDGKKRLNLITCGGVWLLNEQIYQERTVVFTELSTDVE